MFGEFSPLRRPITACTQLALAVGLSASLQACITIYQPLSGLHRPIALDMSYANFENLNLELRCPPGSVVDKEEARSLCRKLKSMFESQGAQVKVAGEVADTITEKMIDEAASDESEQPSVSPSIALTIRLSARLIHEDTSSYIFFNVVTGYTFAQDVTITDESGFLLIREQLTGRFVQQLGFSGDRKAFSKDFYGQLSQLTLNARMRRQVLLESAPQEVGNN